MLVVTKDEIVAWLEMCNELARQPGRSDNYVQYDEHGLYYTHPEAASIHFDLPDKVENLPGFARYLARAGYQDWDFRGAALWFKTWGVWDELEKAIGYQIVDGMHAAAGQPKSFESGLGHFFRTDELTKAIGMLIQPMIFG